MISKELFRYGSFFHYVRQIAKFVLSSSYPIFKIFYKMPKVASVFDTLEYLSENPNCSLVRFGDGEIIYLNDKLNLPFQKYESRLAECYKIIFRNNYPDLLVGLPIGYHDLEDLVKRESGFLALSNSLELPAI